MAISSRTKNILSVALGDDIAAAELISADEGLPTTPSFTSVTTTGSITCGGNLLLPTGKGVEVNSIQVVGSQQAAPTLVAVTFTANPPANYATPTGSLTIANGSAPTVVELVEYCDELRASINNILTALAAHGLIA